MTDDWTAIASPEAIAETRAAGPEFELVVGRLIPRSLDDADEELEEVPASAHVLRTKQEAAGFMFRRSQAFGTRTHHGLLFLAYAASLEVFDNHLRRMIDRDGPPVLPAGSIDTASLELRRS